MDMRLCWILFSLAILVAGGACAGKGDDVNKAIPPGTDAETIVLPPAEHKGGVSLEETLARRRSVREFSAEPLTLQLIGQLLWAAQGITDPAGLRTAPSAGALFPLELYVAFDRGFFHYDPRRHELHRVTDNDLRPALCRAALDQEVLQKTPAVFLIAADVERTAWKYGMDRAPRYVHMEAGHAAQNLLLQAVALGLGGVPVGAFQDSQLRKAALLPDKQTPVYLIPVGHPKGH